jgi:hypothetical protein
LFKQTIAVDDNATNRQVLTIRNLVVEWAIEVVAVLIAIE